MYRCEVCAALVGPRLPRTTYQLYRGGEGSKQIARELAVCRGCKAVLDLDGDWAELYRQLAPERVSNLRRRAKPKKTPTQFTYCEGISRKADLPPKKRVLVLGEVVSVE